MYNSLAAYLDSGSIELFSQQIREALGNVTAIAIRDSDGGLAWNDAARGETPPKLPRMREPVPGVGYASRLEEDAVLYVFYLSGGDDDAPIGSLNVFVETPEPVSFECAYRLVRPVLECIERQIGINAELSAVRRLSSEGQRGLRLLLKIDELDATAPGGSVLSAALEMTAAHYAADVVAVVLPELGIQETCPPDRLDDPEASRAAMATLGALISQAKMTRRVLLTNVEARTAAAIGLKGRNPRLLCSPIINARDQVIGIMVIMGPERFTREQVRLSRAISAKFNSVMGQTRRLADDHYTRHGFMGHVSAVLRRDPHQSHAVLVLDVDRLHVVNDEFGHVAGDLVIRQFAEIIDEARCSDDAAAHLNGDTFALFLRGTSESQAIEKANLLLDAFARLDIESDRRTIDVTASGGIAMIPEVVADAAAAINTAELAVRSAKDRGGGRVVVYRDLDASVARRRSDLDQVNDLQTALMENRFVLYAQPIVALSDEDSGRRFEILVRMTDTDGSLLHPERFLSAAERYQMMASIDRWVVRNTLDRLSASDGILEINLTGFSINISPQSLSDDDFVDFLETRIVESGVSPDTLCFELTETAIVRNLERAQRCIRRLRKLGCRIALDDFGTGYCSFAYLKDLPVQYIKVDGVFVRDLLENPLSESIVGSMTSIAGVMHASTVAEHVESDLVVQRLRQMGIDFVQGFAVGRPRPLADVLADLESVSPGAGFDLDDDRATSAR